MTESIEDALQRVRRRFDAGASRAEVEAFLAAEGYDGRQIGEILTRLFPAPANTPMTVGSTTEGSAQTFRVAGPHERGRFTREAWGHLLRLSGDTLSGAELEHVIERALTQLDGSIALDDLKALLEASGIDEPGAPGSRRIVH
jgi:uncharacterized protein Smg (DUF494 family)